MQHGNGRGTASSRTPRVERPWTLERRPVEHEWTSAHFVKSRLKTRLSTRIIHSPRRVHRLLCLVRQRAASASVESAPGNAQAVDACGQVLCTTGVVSGHVTDSSEKVFPRVQDLFGDKLCTNCGWLWILWGKLRVIHRRARVIPRFYTGPVYKNSRADLRKGRFSTVSTAPTTTTQEITPSSQKARRLRTFLWITAPRGETSNLPLSDRGAILMPGTASGQ